MSSRVTDPPFFRRILTGAFSGFVATAPMTAAMIIGWRFLPARERYLLPPQEITEEFADRLEVGPYLTDRKRDALALLLHFSYGALTGAGYGLIEPELSLPGSIKGSLAGLAVWVGSYLGWLPALKILRSARYHPRRRNILMILAHLVWGITLGVLSAKLNSADHRFR